MLAWALKAMPLGREPQYFRIVTLRLVTAEIQKASAIASEIFVNIQVLA